MKGYIQGKTIILLEDLPNTVKEGDEVEVLIQNISSQQSRFSIFKLGLENENELLSESAELYAEVYQEDKDLQQLTESALIE